MASIVVTYNISPDIKLRVGYRPAGTSFPFTYLSSYLSYNQSPYTIDNLQEGSYEVELTSASAQCGATPCGTPQVFLAQAGDPNTIHTTTEINIDGNSNIFFSVEFSEQISTSVTISGNYSIGGTSKSYSVIVPQGVISYSTILDTTQLSQIDNYCYSTISPAVVNNKNIQIDNTSQC